MFDCKLFLGLPLSLAFQQELDQLPNSMREIFIQSEPSPYLQRIECEGVGYLGKYLGASVELNDLDSLQDHIYSLLKKLIPSYPYEPLLLLSLSSS